MPRSLWKGPFVNPKVLKKLKQAKKENFKRPIKVWSRGSMIVPTMIDLTLSIHNGKKFENLNIKPEMVGYKLGEFVSTRKFIKHAGTKNKVKAKGKH